MWNPMDFFFSFLTKMMQERGGAAQADNRASTVPIRAIDYGGSDFGPSFPGTGTFLSVSVDDL